MANPKRLEDKKIPGVLGRPTGYKKEYCKQLVEHMEGGLSLESFGGVVHVCKQTLYHWLDKHPEFLDSYHKGLTAGRLFWERLGVGGVAGKVAGFRERSWNFNMVNRYRWSARTEHTGEIKTGPRGDAFAKLMSNPEAAEKAAELAELLAEQEDEE